jgi:hypothetical protein
MLLGEQRIRLPIACTLEGGAAKERVGRWQAILSSYRIDRQLTTDTLLLRFRRDDEAERELNDLVVAERDCCSFLGWDLDRDGDELILRISGDADELAALSFAD